MRVGLIDVDGHNFPNLALMRISAYHKAQGDEVEWWYTDFVGDKPEKQTVTSLDDDGEGEDELPFIMD